MLQSFIALMDSGKSFIVDQTHPYWLVSSAKRALVSESNGAIKICINAKAVKKKWPFALQKIPESQMKKKTFFANIFLR